MPLAFSASLYIFGYIFLHGGPPVVSRQCFSGFGDAGMAGSWQVMVLPNELPRTFPSTGDYCLSVLVPGVTKPFSARVGQSMVVALICPVQWALAQLQ
jgi:hypothetical protein